jgi:uncharacterized protein (DUF486 family)
MIKPIAFLIISNLFMTYAWYGHLKDLKSKPLWIAIALSWLVAFFEYCFQVPANRIGSTYFTLPQLKVIQEVITMVIFAIFAVLYMNVPITKNYLYASFCLLGAVYFIFKPSV